MEKLNKLFQVQFDKMCQTTGRLYVSQLSGNQIWDLYLGSFVNDPKFRDPESSEHNCNTCKNQLRRYGNIVAIDENNRVMSIFDVATEDPEYQNTVKVLSEKIKSAGVSDIFVETYDMLNSLPYEVCLRSFSKFKLGIARNTKRYTQEEADKFGVVKPNETRTFHHFALEIPSDYVDKSGKSPEAIQAIQRDKKNVFQRGMKEISLDTLELVRDLILLGSLRDGEAHMDKIMKMIAFKKEYNSIAQKDQDNWCWVNSNTNYAKFRNELIGTLCVELSEGKDLNEACLAWNKRVDPVNYMKASAPITKQQIEQAQHFVETNGYVESFDRRCATLSDIKVSEILHINNDRKETPISIFDKVQPAKPTQHKRAEFDKVETVSIDRFMKEILPNVTSIEAFLTNQQSGNMVTLTTAKIKESKPIFKWSNNYSWTYNGNIAGKSTIREAVKTAGGNVEGILRFSITWNESGEDNTDLDAWCIQPNNERIGYSSPFRKDRGNTKSSCGGQLDLDVVRPERKLAVENIYFQELNKLKNGKYIFFVNPFAIRNSKGFSAEIEMDGEIHQYKFDTEVTKNVIVAEVTVTDGKFSINHCLPETSAQTKLYNLDTNMFHKVNLVCLSPNHWNDTVGNKHYFFFLENCKTDTPVRGFHMENLIGDLLDHRKVLEALGNTTLITPDNNQLSGLGFNSTLREELIIKIKGSHSRVIKIQF